MLRIHYLGHVWVRAPKYPTPMPPLIQIVPCQAWQVRKTKDFGCPVVEVIAVPHRPPYWLILHCRTIDQQRVVQHRCATVAQGSEDLQLAESTFAPSVPPDSGVITGAKPEHCRHQPLRHGDLAREAYTSSPFWPFVVLEHPPARNVFGAAQHQVVPTPSQGWIKTCFFQHPDHLAERDHP